MAIHLESEIDIARPRAEVFGYLAHGERLTEFLDDFKRVTHEQDGEPAQGHVYSYETKQGAEGTFEWTEFRPDDRLAWSGPAAKLGPGSVKPSGSWELSDGGDGATHVKLVMTPEPGGLFKLLAPFMKMGMTKGNKRGLEKLKANLEGAGE